MLYFAYGSNMNREQIRKRCPSARFLGVAAMRNLRIAFTRKSIKRDCGVADVVPENGRIVWGVVYEICDHDIGVLDISEGYRPNRNKNSYWRRECMVFLDNDDQQPLTVYIYFAEHQQNPPGRMPSIWTSSNRALGTGTFHKSISMNCNRLRSVIED